MNVIILTYCYPPDKRTSAQRPHSWVKEFPKYGLYPIIITSNFDKFSTTSSEVSKFDTHEVHRIKLNDFIALQKSKSTTASKLISRLLKAFQPFIHHTSLGARNDFLNYTLKLLEQYDPENTVIVASGNPFYLFNIGHILHQKTSFKWIADYRDDWSTSDIHFKRFFNKYITLPFTKKQERKWLSSASFFITVSDYYVQKIKRFLGNKIEGVEIQNGYFIEEHMDKGSIQKDKDIIKFVYVGSIFYSQNIETYTSCLKEACRNSKKKVEFHFLGTTLPENRKRIIESDAPDNFQCIFHSWMSKEEALNFKNNCDYAVIVPHKDIKGVPSSKLYEFIGAKMPIVYYPNDHDIIEEICTETGLGITAESDNEFTNKLEKLLENKYIPNDLDESKIKSYSRESSSKKLAFVLKDFMKSST